MKQIKAFTLAETMIVLVILGVVAAITIPALVNRHVEAERRTKLKKAMSVYDTALSKMVIENGIKSDTALTNWADSDTKNDCANTSAYFKVSRNLEVDENSTNCKFRASDGVFWDISNIKKPLVALREQDLNAVTADSDTNRAFYMFGWLDGNGSLRSNDLGKIDTSNKADLEKLYDFIAGKTTTSMGEVANGENTTADEQEQPQVKRDYDTIMSDDSLSLKEKLIEISKDENYIITREGLCMDLTSNSFMMNIANIFDQKSYAIPIIPTAPIERCVITIKSSATGNILYQNNCQANYDFCVGISN